MIKNLSYLGATLLWIALLWLFPICQAKAVTIIGGKKIQYVSQTTLQETLQPLPSEKVYSGVERKTNYEVPKVKYSEADFELNVYSGVEKKTNYEIPKVKYSETHVETYDGSIISDGYFRGKSLGFRIGESLRKLIEEK